MTDLAPSCARMPSTSWYIDYSSRLILEIELIVVDDLRIPLSAIADCNASDFFLRRCRTRTSAEPQLMSPAVLKPVKSEVVART